MYLLKHHPNLSVEKWNNFSVEKQIFMIANELNRLITSLKVGHDEETVKFTIERALELTDLSLECQRKNLRFEILRWRYLFSALYLMDLQTLQNSVEQVENLLKVLLLLNSKSSILT